MKIDIKKTMSLMIVILFLISTNAVALRITNNSNLDDNKTIIKSTSDDENLDPLVNLKVTVTIKEIRALESKMLLMIL